jgi:hypothetical protein
MKQVFVFGRSGVSVDRRFSSGFKMRLSAEEPLRALRLDHAGFETGAGHPGH